MDPAIGITRMVEGGAEPKDIFESIDRLIVLETERIRLLRELKKALRLAELAGVPAKDVKGRMQSSVQSTGVSSYDPRPWLKMVFRLKLEGDTTWREWPLKDVHKDLWPQSMLDAYAKYERNRAKPMRHAAKLGEDQQ